MPCSSVSRAKNNFDRDFVTVTSTYSAFMLASWKTALALSLSFAAFCAAARSARANGTFPAVNQLVADPQDPSRLVLRSTFGLLFSQDGGKTWDWDCEGGLGYTNTLPPVALLSGGGVVLGVPGGVARGEFAGCDFGHAAGLSSDGADVSAVRGDMGHVVALSVDYAAHVSQVWESADSGRTFAAISATIPDFTATTLDVAPSDSKVLYVSGMPQAAGATGQLLTSLDHGGSFVAHDVPGSTGLGWPYIAAIDPLRPERIYVRLADVPGRLLVSDDGGESFLSPLTVDYELQAFALSPDGKTVVVSSPASGTFRASSEELKFQRVSCTGVSCLMWNTAGLFACGEPTINGFAVGRSADQGQSYTRLLDFSCIKPSFNCSASSSVGAKCPAEWQVVAPQLEGFGACDPEAPAPPLFNDCLGMAGGGGSGVGGSTSGGATGAGAGGQAPLGGSGNAGHGGNSGAGATGASERPGCGCHFTRSTPWVHCWPAIAALLHLQRRRARQRLTRTRRIERQSS